MFQFKNPNVNITRKKHSKIGKINKLALLSMNILRFGKLPANLRIWMKYHCTPKMSSFEDMY